MSVPEISVQLKNTPGQLVQITAILAEAGVNIKAVTASSAGKTGWVRFIVDKPKLAEEALEDCGIQADAGEALAVLLPDEVGSLDRALRVLADQRINVDYLYICPNRSTETLVILGVQTPGKAEKMLKQNGIETI
ncbi:MAG: ACT domain-containing protein [Candidatus Sumerlaeaceae bacterium]